ncbi:MAG TPA: hypothetical protein VGH52_11380 [Gaiellaceae bacterium]|jgi:hypothetical protein
MDIQLTEGRRIVGSDDRKIGRVVGERNDCVLVETGHVFKATKALPKEFVHEIDGELRATIAKEIVDGSPDTAEEWNPAHILSYYGMGTGPYEVGDEEPELDEARIAYGNDGSYAPVLPRKN